VFDWSAAGSPSVFDMGNKRDRAAENFERWLSPGQEELALDWTGMTNNQ
jgi:hypothetical protein